MKIKKAAVKKFSAKLTQPFRTARGQHDDLTNILFGIELENGIQGFGEAAVATHITGETVSETLRNLTRFKKILIGHDINSLVIASGAKFAIKLGGIRPDESRRTSGGQSSDSEIVSSLSLLAKTELKSNPCALAAVEMAVLDALSQAKKIPFWKLFGEKRSVLKTDMTVVLGTLEEAKKAAKEICARGIGAIKIKVGRNEEEDLDRVVAVKSIAKKRQIYLDANQGFTANQTLWFLTRLERFSIRPVLIEQPVPKYDWEGLRYVTRKSGVTVIADESVSCYEDARRLAKGKYAHGINIKFMKFGILEALRIAKFARKEGLKLMLGGMMETELGTTASAHFAAGLGGFDYIDLDSQFFLKEKVMNRSFVSRNGVYHLSKIKTGIGVKPCFNLFS